MRGASTFAVVLAYFTVIARITQLISILMHSEKGAQLSYGLATVFILLMWFHEFATENADIVHEAHPTQQVIENMREAMFPNYNK